MVVFLMMPIIEFSRSLGAENLQSFIPSIFVAICGLTAIQIILNIQHNQELIITIFFIILHSACILIFFKWDPQMYNSSPNSYFAGSVNVLFESATANRIPKFTYRTSFRVLLMLARFILLPIEDQGIVIIQIMCCVFSVYLDYDREEHDQGLFESYFYSKEQLNKFKELVVNDIPEGIAVFSQNLTQCFFANNSFQGLQEDFSRNLQAFLNRFTLYEISESTSKLTTEGSLPYLTNVKESLFNLILKFMTRENPSTILQTKQKTKFNLRFNQEGKSESIFEAKLVSLFWDEKPAIAIILHDITQQDAIIRLRLSANLQKDRILATVSHELRTPLNSILGMIHIAQQKIKDPEVLQYLKICNNSGDLLLGSVNSILDLNLIRANKLKLYNESIHFADFLKDIIQLFEYQCKLKSIYLKLALSPFIPKYIITDKNRLSQIFINLIGNAVKFTSKGGIMIFANLCYPNTDQIEITIKDTGIGIKQKDQESLFQILGKVEQEIGGTAVNTQGVGLGLIISNNLAKLLSSDKSSQGIVLKSEEGKGSTFSFKVSTNLDPASHPQDISSYEDLLTEYLNENEGDYINPISKSFFSPLKKPQGSQLINPIPQLSFAKNPNTVDSDGPTATARYSYSRACSLHSKSPTASLTPKHPQNFTTPYILIVDDNPLNFKVIEYFIMKQQYLVKTALSGQTAIEILLRNNHSIHPVKLILMDLQMPIMDGYEATRMVKQLMGEGKIPEIPIVALTANDGEDDRRACFDVGMCGYLTKPIKESEFCAALKKFTKN